MVPRAPEDIYWAACPPGPDPGGFDMRDLFVLPRDWNLAPHNGEGMVRRARELAALLDFRAERAVESCQAPLYCTSAPHARIDQCTFHELHDKQLNWEEIYWARSYAQARTRTKLALLRKLLPRGSSGWTPDANVPLVPGRVQSPFSSARWPDQRLHAHLDSGMQDVELPPDRQEMPASKKPKHYKRSVNLRHVIGNMKLNT